MEYDYDLYRISVVQALWRKMVVMRNTRYILFLVARLQAVCRGFLVRRSMNRLGGFPTEQNIASLPKSLVNLTELPTSAQKTSIRKSFEKARKQIMQNKRAQAKRDPDYVQPSEPEEARIHHVGAIIIQTYWRSYVCRIYYYQSLTDVITIQSVARRWLAVRRLGNGPMGRQAGIGARNRCSKPPRPQSKLVSKCGGRFAKIESFESRNLSSLAAESQSLGSSKKMNSLDDSVPSVPFRILPDDDPSEPPSLTPPRKARGQNSKMTYGDSGTTRLPHTQKTAQNEEQGHFEDASRFGGRKNEWNGSGASGQYATNGSYGSNESNSAVSSSGGSKKSRPYAYSENSKWNRQVANDSYNRQPNNGSGAYHATGRSTTQYESPGRNAAAAPAFAKPNIPRSKGWNVDEEIEKEATRNLIMAWKQKDQANTFTIRPRVGL
jgi:hypothetical protein